MKSTTCQIDHTLMREECKYPFLQISLIVNVRLNLLFPFGGCSVLQGFVGSSFTDFLILGSQNLAHQLARLVFSWFANTTKINRTY